MGKEGKGYSENVDVLGLEQPVGADIVGGAAQASANDLFTEKLAGERAQAHDVGDRLRVPAFGEHSDRDHFLYLFALLAALPHRIHLTAQHFGLLLPGRLAGAPVLLAPGSYLRDRLLGGLGSGEHLGVDVKRALGIAQFLDADTSVVEGMLDPGCRLGAVGHGDHHGRSERRASLPCLPRRPVLGRLAPVVAEQVVAVHDQVRQRLLGSGVPAQVVLDLGIVVDVV